MKNVESDTKEGRTFWNREHEQALLDSIENILIDWRMNELYKAIYTSIKLA